jgi:hypothetical protein
MLGRQEDKPKQEYCSTTNLLRDDFSHRHLAHRDEMPVGHGIVFAPDEYELRIPRGGE